MARPTAMRLRLLMCLLLLQLSYTGVSKASDLQPLMAFKSASDASDALNWNTTADPCSFSGVSCVQGRVSRLVLEGYDLRGTFEALTGLTQLRVLSLKRNRLSGAIPDLSKLTALKLLFLSENELSGELPVSLTSLSRLYRLDLSYNNLSGEIPASLNRLTHLLTFRVEENRFTGSIGDLSLPSVMDFNVSGNRLTGKIPVSFSRFPASAFGDNPALCGAPLAACRGLVDEPTKPGQGSGGAVASPVVPSTTVASSPSSMPVNTSPISATRPGGGSKMSPAILIVIVLGDILALAVIAVLLYCFFCRVGKNPNEPKSHISEGEKIVYSTTPYPTAAHDRGRMVFFEGVRRFELEDLLKASAEMLGKGGFGTAYKAVLDDGNVVAVKRLKEANVGGKREFEQHMELLGRLRHPNVVSLVAYYFARDEKLLVYDYMPNGSLFWLLHGNRGPGRTPVDWTTRINIAAGAARGLAFIHSSCKALKLSHGNIKSTNILLDKIGNARVSDFGISAFSSPAASASRPSSGYHAPESADGRKPSQKADVYAFGVLLLELLTGKCPSMMDDGSGYGYGYSGAIDLPRWVQSVVREEWTAEVFDLELMRYKDIEEEMVSLLQIAMACASASPEQRPKMSQVLKMIEDIRGVDDSPSRDNFESVSDSPSVSEDTYRASE
uniref:Protein kinase domain-containing protein n=1 Tax=Kalanchoe fedtschenkoi TaxID=63787 RepID=A0A7N0VB18_KALFE